MATTGPGQEEIIEKKATDPVALACLVLACLALLGAIIFPIAEIAAYRSGGTPATVKKGPGQDRAEKFLRTLKEDVENLIRSSSPGQAGEKEFGTEEEPAGEALEKPAAAIEEAEPTEESPAEVDTETEPAETKEEPAEPTETEEEPAPAEE